MKGLRIRTVALALAGVSLTGLVAPLAGEAHAQDGARRDFNIPAQPMANALEAFGRQSGRDIMFDRGQVAGLRSTAVQGSLEPGEALRRLVVGSGLSVSAPNGATFVVGRGPGEGQAGSAAADSESANQEIVVTGTNIAGRPPIGSPVVTITRDDIERQGASSVRDVLAQATQNFNGGGTDPNRVGPAFFNSGAISVTNTDFSSSANLRGLGPGATLILVNGQRLTASAGSGGDYSDISQIPISAIERIDILTDGASAIYGSDAVAGVVNIILRSNFRGAETRLRLGTYSQPGGEEAFLSQTIGAGWHGGNILITGQISHNEEVRASDRNATRGVLAPGGIGDYFIAPRGEGRSITARVNQSLSPSVRIDGTASYSRRESDSFFVNELFSNFGIISDVTFSNLSEQFSFATTLTADLSPRWSLRASGGYSRNSYDQSNPIDANTGPDGLQKFAGIASQINAEIAVSGSLLRLPAGFVRMASGLGIRRDSLRTSIDSNGTLSGFGPAASTNRYGYAELSIPLISNAGREVLSASVAARYENYSSFGSEVSPKLGVSLSPVEGLTLRSSFSRSFRAPRLQQLDPANRSIFLATIVDPRNPPNRIRILRRGGTQDELGPERSRNFTAGIDFRPSFIRGLLLSATLYDIRFSNQIGTPNVPIATYLADPALQSRVAFAGSPGFAEQVSALLSGSSGSVGGCPAQYRSGTACLEPAGNFGVIIDGRIANLAEFRNRGFDARLEQNIPAFGGNIVAQIAWTHLFRYDRQIIRGAPRIDVLDTIYNPVSDRVRAEGFWRDDRFNIGIVATYTGSYQNTSFIPPAGITSWLTFDLSGSFRVSSGPLSGVSIAFNVTNIFDRDPPFVSNPGQVGNNYDSANADPFGRRFALTISKQW